MTLEDFESNPQVQKARDIFLAGVKRVDPMPMIQDCLKLDGKILSVQSGMQEVEYDLSVYPKILVIGAGKATAKLALGLEQVLGRRINTGLISVKHGHTEPLKRIGTIEAGHPVPDKNSVHASEKILELVDEADEKTLVITLISGGGSALLTLPFKDGEHQLTLDDIQKTTSLLLASGAAIGDVNCVRKHLSGISGGRLAARIVARGATGLTLILSDVLGDNLESIASGPTVGDSSTFAQAAEIMDRYKIRRKLPKAVAQVIDDGLAGILKDTPKPEDPLFSSVKNILLGTNALALRAASAKAVELGYSVLILSSQISGEAREIAKVCTGIARDSVARGLPLGAPACIILGGETTVTLHGRGKGGRNQEMALAFLAEMAADPKAFRGVTFLSAGTDGNDGPTDAAGAFATLELAVNGAKDLPAIYHSLEKNDSYHYFQKNGGLYITGPTNTNVCDIQLILVDPS